jgi:hypothetical protein
MKFQKIFFTFTFFVSLVLLEPQVLWAAPGIPSVPQAEKKIYTVIEFESSFMNRRKEEILKTLGEPDSKIQVQGKEVWKYNQMVKDKEQIWDQNIMFDFGRVNYIWSDQPTGKGNNK